MTTTLQPLVAPLAAPRCGTIGPNDHGRLMSPEEFDALDDRDECDSSELVNGVLIVEPLPTPDISDANGELGDLLRTYAMLHPGVINTTLDEADLRVRHERRRADRVVWIGLGRIPDPRSDIPAIAVEFVSEGTRSRQRDYEVKRMEYLAAGVREYWIFDRFRRTLTVCRSEELLSIAADAEYSTPLLPGFRLPVAAILKCADDWQTPETSG